jgi:hypothetical protein
MVGTEDLHPPGPDRIRHTVAVDGPDEEPTRRLQLGDDLGFDHDGSGEGTREISEVANS